MAKETTEAIVTDEVVEVDVSDKPGKADVVADTVNVFEAVKAEAVDEAAKAKANEANEAKAN